MEIFRLMRYWVIFYVFLICLSCNNKPPFSKTISIHDSSFTGEVQVEKILKLNKYKISIENSVTGGTDKIFTPYEIFAMETGDINHDGRSDICLGIIKPTPFDSLLKRRLFIFQIDNDFIRPLWLGSRLVYPLEEFVIEKDKENHTTIKTMERQGLKTYCINVYEWQSFGLTYIAEHGNMLSYSEAHSLLKRNKTQTSYNNEI
ncbi:MAG: hypothetical protein IPJ37_08765 [Bacteroidales bacterium]|nr:hypothetical protein [Bacteroidales bacterium]